MVEQRVLFKRRGRVKLVSSISDLPDVSQVLESWTIGPLPADGSGVLESLLSSGGVTFSSGTQYWVVVEVADSGTFDIWDENDQGYIDHLEDSGDGGTTWQSVGSGLAALTPAFDVLGTPATTTTTPEPASMVLLGTGLLGLALAVRRRIRASA